MNVIINDLFKEKPEKIENSVIINYTISKLEECYKFLENNLGSSEQDIQNWLDEDDKKHKWRMMIFGLEYNNHLSQKNDASGKRLDIFMSNNPDKNNLIIVELKSPNCDIFSINEITKPDGTKSSSYELSDHLSRAIPQVLGYKRDLEALTQTKKDDYNLPSEYIISKCIIVIGSNDKLANSTAKQKFKDFRESFNSGLEIWTYSDLISKINITIENLKKFSTQ